MSEAEDWSMTESYAQLKVSLLIALLVLACSASVVIVNRKGSLGASASPSKDSFIIPYWLPYFGHFFHLWYNWQGFFRRAKMTSAVQSLVTIQVLGQRCAIILKPDLSKKVFERQASSLNQNTLHWHMLANVYGADAKLWESFMKVNQAPSYYGNEELASDLTLRINASLESHLPDLVSFSESAIDQYEWERLANATLTEQTYGMRLRPAVEIDLLALLRSFTGAIHLTSLVGSDFSDTCPSALKDISDFEHGWKYLLIRVSPWLPIPPLTKAYIARRTLTKVISSFYDALHAEASSEPLPSQWRDLSDVSPVVKARSAFWRNQGVPKSLRVAADLEFIWDLNVTYTALVSWMLIHILNTSDLLDWIRHECTPHVKMIPGPRVGAISAQPLINIYGPGLATSCPALNKVFDDVADDYFLSLQIAQVVEAFSLPYRNSQKTAGPESSDTLMKAGMYVIGEGPLTKSDDGNSAFAYSPIGPPHSTTREIVKSSVLSSVAGILTFWDISPDRSKAWHEPRPTSDSPISQPAGKYRVKIARRNFSD